MNHPTDTTDVGAANLAFARALLDELTASGVVTAVVCPGSRSTPLALAVAQQGGLAHTVHIDERNAAFHALGHAKATGRPVVLVCTSGTAGANFLPAVAEACHARVPLVVLTADRPPELRAWGAAQTMEQRRLYDGFTRWSEEAPCPSERGPDAAYARALARRAVCEATGPAPGPVHLNLPFREPLVPATGAAQLPAAGPVRAVPSSPLLEPRDTTGWIASELRRAARGVLVFGPDAWDASLAASARALAASLGWPVLADPASGLRAGAGLDGWLMHGADLLLRDADTAAALQPDLIVRFGGQPTSKALSLWMARHASADVWLVDPAAGFRDPQHRAGRVLRVGSRQFCDLGSDGTVAPPAAVRPWLARWQHADRLARAALADALALGSRLLAPHVAQVLWSAMPAGAALYVANSMAIREIDAFAGPRAGELRVLANRGVNGIDGQVSAALGAAAALRVPTVLWCGDLTLLHDLSGLLAGRLHGADLTIVVTNDDGGGIFEYLPVAQSVPRSVFEPLFAVPHGLDLGELARGLGWNASRVDAARPLAEALSHALRGGLNLIEVPVDRSANTAIHLAVNEAVRSRLQAEPLP
jgi:2-succinyl-5-enolpyruvyl-6-hydroxy-3-cyclohexene-1-carboxylate synthase